MTYIMLGKIPGGGGGYEGGVRGMPVHYPNINDTDKQLIIPYE